MILTMFIASIGLASFIIYIAGSVTRYEEYGFQKEYREVQDLYNNLMREKESIITEKKSLKEETDEIFTLYDMTRDITKNFDAQDAFEIFKNKLKESTTFEECLLLDPLSKEVRSLKNTDEYFLFTLKSKRRNLGVLAIKNLLEEDKEKLFILGHQFALTMRRLKLYQEVERFAITDSLTEVHTRRYFLERFEEELKRANKRRIKLSFLMIDVDHFKKCNDRYGHMTGDQMLKEVGAIIKENIREIDIVGRYGGEEFCVVLPDTDGEGAHFVAERIRSSTDGKPIKAYDATINVTLSIGVATAPKDGKLPQELIDKADWALYRAKKLGRNTVCAFGVYKE